MNTRITRAAVAAALCGACLALAGCAPRPPGPPPERPNIVLILADDLGYSDIGPYGSEIRTPNLDRMAAAGLRFRQFYNAAKCSPTRAALLTGLYAHEAGMAELPPGRGKSRPRGPYQGFLPDSVVTLADALRAAGYRTYMSGKWHIGDEPDQWPRRRGFDRYFGLISGATSYFELLQEPGNLRQMTLEDAPWTPPAEGFYATDAYTDYAVARVREHADRHGRQPFFLYLAYTAPHFPLHALPEDLARYRGRYDAGWDALRAERYARMRRMGVLTPRHALAPRPPQVPPWETAEGKAEWARRMEVYAAMVDRMDQGIGRVLAALGETGALENTLVLFLSDNGGCPEEVAGRRLGRPGVPTGARGSYAAYEEPWAYASNTPFRLYKNFLHEGGINTPVVAYWPRGIRTPGAFTDAVGHVIDVLPTFLDLAGAPAPEQQQSWRPFPLTGRSLVPALTGGALAARGPLYWAYGGHAAVRDGDWKLVYEGRRSRAWELFNLAEDPTELHNLAAREPARAAALAGAWRAWAARAGVREEIPPLASAP